ncbi:MAG: maltose acetyltransferase domain-containing protein, partial [Shewanella oncorhynchi]
MTEFQKMITGQEYDCLDSELLSLRAQQQRLNRQLNQTIAQNSTEY